MMMTRRSPKKRSRRQSQAGLTLVELTIAIGILGVVVGLMIQITSLTIKGRDLTYEQLRAPKVANAILGQIFKDFRYIWYGGLVGDVGFLGKSDDQGGKEADRVDFITARRTRTVGSEDDGGRDPDDRTSPLTEVGYACRTNDDNSDWLELWRREDYFVDSDPTSGGQYSMIYDKIRSFDLKYYPIPEESTEEHGLDEWDSRTKHGIPYAILMTIEYDVEEPRKGAEYEKRPEKIIRIILLRGAYSVKWPSDGEEETPGSPGTPTPGGG